MESIHTLAFRSDRPFGNVIEGHLEGPAFDVRVQRTKWKERGEGVFEPSMCFIEMFLSASKQIRGSFVSTAPTSEHPHLGNISFIPEHTALYCSWAPGIQRCISCMFDIRTLSERTAMEWTWPSFDLEEALDIRNEYVSLGLRRIAEELLSPGFASERQVECSLMFVALELTRHFRPKVAANLANSRLSPGQLAVLRSMMIDSAVPPTISEMATACGMGGRRLAHSYRSATGITLRSFIARARLHRAKMLLCDGRILIKQIAYDAGFRSAAAFTAAFRKDTGLTPVEFRASKVTSKPHRSRAAAATSRRSSPESDTITLSQAI
jgi:AraC family transcriptional regulator